MDVLVVAAVTVVLSASKCGLLRAVGDVIGQSPRRWNSQLITCIITFFADMVGNVCIKNKKWERRRYSFVVLEMVTVRNTHSMQLPVNWQIIVQLEKNRLSISMFTIDKMSGVLLPGLRHASPR